MTLRFLVIAHKELLQLRRRLADEIGIVAQVSAHVHGRAQGREILRFEGFQQVRIHVQFLGSLQGGESFLFAAAA